MLPKLEEMTLEQKLGFVFCVRRFREEDIEFVIKMIKKRAIGCIQLPERYPEICDRILKEADYPILIINDTETGFPTSKLPPVPLMSLAACGKKEYYQAYAKWVVSDAKKAKFNGTWGPVIDIVQTDKNSDKVPNGVYRKISNNPYKVAEAAAEIAKIYKDNHYLSTGKHYPGGDCEVDTHMTEGWCDFTKEDLKNKTLIPYYKLMKKDLLPCIMVDHSSFPKIDPEYPASLSKEVIDIIREDGFDGIMFTDSFAMMGIIQKYGEENIYGRAIYAGIDIILPNYRTSVEEGFNYLKKNFEDGVFSEERLDEAVARVLKALEFVSTEPENPTEFTKEDEMLLKNLSKDCITAICDEGLSANFTTPDNERLFVVVTEINVGDASHINEIALAKWYEPDKIVEKIKTNFPESGVVTIPEFSNQIHHEKILNLARDYKEVVFVTFCNHSCYLGVDELTKRTEILMDSLLRSDKLSTVVHFGNPFAIKNLRHIPRKIFGYMIPESQEYAIDALKGTIEAKGTLPFDIEFK